MSLLAKIANVTLQAIFFLTWMIVNYDTIILAETLSRISLIMAVVITKLLTRLDSINATVKKDVPATLEIILDAAAGDADGKPGDLAGEQCQSPFDTC